VRLAPLLQPQTVVTLGSRWRAAGLTLPDLLGRPRQRPRTLGQNQQTPRFFYLRVRPPVSSTYASNATVCPTDRLAWYYDNPAAPKAIHLCPNACDFVTVTESGSHVSVVLGCMDTVTIL